MRLVEIFGDAIVVRLDPEDCLALSDACIHTIRNDAPGDWALLDALASALAAAALAAFAIAHGNGRDPHTLATLRQTWAPRDTRLPERPRLVASPMGELRDLLGAADVAEPDTAA